MELIHYADGSILTGSAISRALVDYAQILATNGMAATVEVPTRETDGSVGHATLLLGPASQMMAVDVESGFDEIEDAELLGFLQRETLKQRGAEVKSGEQDPLAAATDLEWNE